MRRSYLALGVVIVVATIAIYIHLQPPPDEAPPIEPTGKAKAVTPPKPTAVVPPLVEGAEDPEDPDQPTIAAPPKVAAPTPTTPDEAIKAAEAHLAAGRAAAGMKALSDAIAGTTDAAKAKPLRERLAKLVQQHFFSSKPSPLATLYTVAAGDNLRKIAAKHNTTDDYIARINGIRDKDRIRVGQRLKIVQGGFDIEIVKSQFKLTVTKDGVWVREIKVGLGKDGATPVGSFLAGPKVKNPPYTAVYPPIPFGDKKNNPLGTRWITIAGAGGNEYGIHGTWEPDSIGKEKSKGCIRMLNQDVEWLYDLVVRGKSKIVIKP